MYDPARTDVASALIDFSLPQAPAPLVFEDRLQGGSIILAHCRTAPNPKGAWIVSPQTTVVVPAGPAFDLEWHGPDSNRVQSSTIGRGRVILYAADVPIWKRWTGSPSIFVFAIAPAFIEDVRQRAFEPSNGSTLRTLVGLTDPTANELVRLAERELRQGGPRGRLYLEGLATALAVHILQTYGGDKQSDRRAGGLPPVQLRRVTDYVKAHLSDDMALADLAGTAGLSPHHFGDAFKTAMGLSPHQYVIERRVERARELLGDASRTVAEIAYAVGFSSQSHLTRHFRRVTGETPARFRRAQGEISDR